MDEYRYKQLLEGDFITVPEVDNAIRALEARIAALKGKREEIGKKPVDQVLAEKLHEQLCGWNHTDGCSWYYGSWENPTYAHEQFLAKARKLLARTGGDMSKAMELMELVREMR